METVQSIISKIPESTYVALGAGLAVSGVLQLLKKWLSLQSPKVITFLLGLLSFATVAIAYLTQAVTENPAVLGQKTAVIMGISTVIYRFLIQPLDTITKEAKAERERKLRVAAKEALVTPNDANAIDALALEIAPVGITPAAPEEFTV